MEMGEPIALPDLVVEQRDPCWFCEQPRQAGPSNQEREDPAGPEGEASGPENGEHNDASVLGKALGKRPSWRITHKVDPEDPVAEGTTTEITPAAHHLLPGHASVNKAAQLHKYMLWQGKNPLGLVGPIGYDINSAENGVWLPGNYAVHEGSEFQQDGARLKDAHKDAYARAAMRASGDLQLHDAHPAYDDHVLNTLRDVAKKLDALWIDRTKCPLCKKDLANQNDPPYGLVGRLNALAAQHKRALVYTAANRKAIDNGYVTSSRVPPVSG